MAPRRLLFVCLGNICRSPSAEGLFRHAVEGAGLSAAFEIDSAGTGGWHQGDPPDPRASAAAAARGVDLSGQRARQVRRADFDRFDRILAMDAQNLAALDRLAHASGTAALSLMLDFAPGPPGRSVPDPYYGGSDGFETMLDLLEAATAGLLAAEQALIDP